MQRVNKIVNHVAASDDTTAASSAVARLIAAEPTSASMSSSAPDDDDVVVCCALRTAIAKARKGGFKDSAPEDLLAPLFKAVLERTKVDPKKIGDVQIGNCLQPGSGAGSTRMSMFLADFPVEVPAMAINRQCSSGLQAVANVAAGIKAGTIDIGLAGGVESMSLYAMGQSDTSKMSSEIPKNDLAAACMIPMGITSENVAEQWKISRETQDQMAVGSHAKAVAAQKQGLFDSEIVPVTATIKDKDGKTSQVVVKTDEGPRAETNLEGLSKLKAAFKQGGSTTAGNASQVSDGAALVLLARRSAAKELGLPILARMRSFAVVGVDPKVMGIGPAYAIPSALDKAGLKVDDIDIYEINEAFASQATMSVQHLNIPMEKVNPKGGAIALGHPLGCTGARQVATLLPELKRTGKKLGVVSMCIGTGMGAAGVFESEQ
mmetsp:Transcript_32782/g.70440  ORF Transcript_32782/g.70440 Transcript_32782/m.70440 type:complete len:434 (+) Transcript_32782:85-1386(+)